MRRLLKPLQVLYSIYALLTFVLLMLPVFAWSLLVAPMGKVRGGNLIYRACVLWGDIWFALIFVQHRNIFETPLQKHQSYIFVANHISYFDVPTIVKTFRRPIRPLGKAEAAKMPVFGFIYKNTIVTVDRGSVANRAKSVSTLKSILMKEISVLVFPEGTFNESPRPLKSFYNGAFRIAIETGTPIKPVLLLDTYDRLHYRSVFSLTPGKNRAVFLAEVSTEGLTLADIPQLKAKVQQQMEEGLIKYNASWIKTNLRPA